MVKLSGRSVVWWVPLGTPEKYVDPRSHSFSTSFDVSRLSRSPTVAPILAPGHPINGGKDLSSQSANRFSF